MEKRERDGKEKTIAILILMITVIILTNMRANNPLPRSRTSARKKKITIIAKSRTNTRNLKMSKFFNRNNKIVML